MAQLHILNGDALAAQFPERLSGDKIIFREALVEGPAEERPLWEYYDERAEFLKFTYGQYEIPDYFADAVPELNKLRSIDSDKEVNLWFEEDLFCQVNLWYLIYELSRRPLFLVRPTGDIEYGFGSMSEEDLVNAFLQRYELNEDEKNALTCLWSAYVATDIAQFRRIATSLPESLAFIRPSIYANIDRQPDEESPGRLIRRLKEIIADLDTTEFAPVFREFSRTEAVYGFGDLQVKRLFDIAVKAVK